MRHKLLTVSLLSLAVLTGCYNQNYRSNYEVPETRQNIEPSTEIIKESEENIV